MLLTQGMPKGVTAQGVADIVSFNAETLHGWLLKAYQLVSADDEVEDEEELLLGGSATARVIKFHELGHATDHLLSLGPLLVRSLHCLALLGAHSKLHAFSWSVAQSAAWLSRAPHSALMRLMHDCQCLNNAASQSGCCSAHGARATSVAVQRPLPARLSRALQGYDTGPFEAGHKAGRKAWELTSKRVDSMLQEVTSKLTERGAWQGFAQNSQLLQALEGSKRDVSICAQRAAVNSAAGTQQDSVRLTVVHNCAQAVDEDNSDSESNADAVSTGQRPPVLRGTFEVYPLPASVRSRRPCSLRLPIAVRGLSRSKHNLQPCGLAGPLSAIRRSQL